MLPIFITHCLGFPLPGSPLTFLHPKLPVDWHSHPSEKRRGGCGWAAGICWWCCKLRTSHIICRNVMHSHVIIICLHKHSCGSISSKSNHLPSPPTLITCAPPSKNVSQVWKHLSNNIDAGLTSHCPYYFLLWHITWYRALRTPPPVCFCSPLCHLKDASPGLPHLHTLCFGTSSNINYWGCLPWSATVLLSAMSLDIEH